MYYRDRNKKIDKDALARQLTALYKGTESLSYQKKKAATNTREQTYYRVMNMTQNYAEAVAKDCY